MGLNKNKISLIHIICFFKLKSEESAQAPQPFLCAFLSVAIIASQLLLCLNCPLLECQCP